MRWFHLQYTWYMYIYWKWKSVGLTSMNNIHVILGIGFVYMYAFDSFPLMLICYFNEYLFLLYWFILSQEVSAWSSLLSIDTSLKFKVTLSWNIFKWTLSLLVVCSQWAMFVYVCVSCICHSFSTLLMLWICVSCTLSCCYWTVGWWIW